ncbi:MAG: ATP-dependent Clp protease proteolytic subunit [Verrucomicrobiota bacterium]
MNPTGRYILPEFRERSATGERVHNPYTKLFEERIIFLGVQIDDASADDVMAQLLCLESMDPDRDIQIYINSPGGSYTAMTAIYDTIQFVKPQVQTVCLGQAASAAAVILAAGTPGKRFALPHARILIHQPYTEGGGQGSDIEIQANEIIRMRAEMEGIIAFHTGKTPEQIDAAIRQLVSKAITTEGQVIDVFAAAGLKTPNIGILDDKFLAEVRGLKHKNVAAELLEKLLKDELKVRSKRNLVQSQVFSEKLKKTLNAYHNRAISTMEVIEELIRLAKEVQESGNRTGLTPDEWAFYDALATSDSAKQAMGDDKLKLIAAELIVKVRQSVTIDWTLRESARAKIKVMVKRILNKYGYPPDLQEEAVKTVLAQAELLCAEWV